MMKRVGYQSRGKSEILTMSELRARILLRARGSLPFAEAEDATQLALLWCGTHGVNWRAISHIIESVRVQRFRYYQKMVPLESVQEQLLDLHAPIDNALAEDCREHLGRGMDRLAERTGRRPNRWDYAHKLLDENFDGVQRMAYRYHRNWRRIVWRAKKLLRKFLKYHCTVARSI